MKFSQYFLYIRKRPDRSIIKIEWIEYVLNNAVQSEVQSDNRIRKWGWISEAGKFLRVILLPDGETVHNAFFDRNYKGTKP